ncbi:hypothetical protein [Rhizobium sp. RU36D]|uniref:hypothetical protein n=1 Tax=Rhizobium sp. RU36D TaxID=1907415 RepID=UPI0009D8E4CA|nr:hypothetical protein [Rhizobium sp. RU36D]SMD20349.1 hypothetical protein SAMN05880593_15312 [Rhizobium sp. RU36D]
MPVEETKYAPWEYVVRTFDRHSDDELTSLLDAEGEQEWELVSFDFQMGRAVFKRPKRISEHE